MREKLLDPTGLSEQAVDTTLTSRLRSLRGLTAGLLDNGKPNAALLLAETGRELRRGHGIRDFVSYQKRGTSAGPSGSPPRGRPRS
jgi:hypothetical protein